jgi:hypothetical protein
MYTGLALLSVISPLLAHAQTHCSSKEVEYFSCKIKGSEKVVSLCGSVFRESTYASANIVDDAWVQYRFGKPGNVELTYPEKRRPLLGNFSADFIVANDARLYVLGFKRGGYSYEVTYSPGFRGVKVKGRGVDAEMPCDGEPKLPRRQDLNDFSELVMMLNRQG